MKKGTIILLNGVSSSGKSTLSKQLTNLLPDFFHLSGDDYDLVIEKMEDRVNERLIPVPTEYFIHRTIAMFSDKGINLIVDQILHNDETFVDCLEVLHHYPVLFVGVHCPLDELSRREKERGDRKIGQAVFQLEYVHQQKEEYDIEVNTKVNTVEECAELIVKQLEKPMNGFSKTYSTHKNQ
ncbi:chloramphenicol phosphotransferase CPT family protein [Bacillus suaedaesalsae]|uniref:AAA family ATPase n=1 Tax=Bacillus suaedaesalsae TaxID=2810349 RepID=A0ABS2DGY2_9BACI|nr:AAA family ATPase [Bacillus suaedaesalsae]MBM6617734.1 AAA family ATPase [Bacillus suaedaesalsae]